MNNKNNNKSNKKNKNIIYLVTSPSGKQYIGKTNKELEFRKGRYFYRAFELNKEGKFILNTKFATALRKYGDKLTWKILAENISDKEINNLEKKFIKQYDSYNNGYNSTEGGDGGNTYAKMNDERLEEVLKKVSDGIKLSLTEERRKEMSERSRGKNNPMYGKIGAMKGKHHTDEAKQKIRITKQGEKNPFYGKHHTEETKLKIKASNSIRKTLLEYKDKIDKSKLDALSISTYRVEKPYGFEIWMELNKFYVYKLIHINMGGRSSLQSHQFKYETNYVIEGKAEVLLEDENGIMQSKIYGIGEGWSVPIGKKHRVIATTDYTALEVSTPHLNDVIRYQDDTNRESGKIEREHAIK